MVVAFLEVEATGAGTAIRLANTVSHHIETLSSGPVNSLRSFFFLTYCFRWFEAGAITP